MPVHYNQKMEKSEEPKKSKKKASVKIKKKAKK